MSGAGKPQDWDRLGLRQEDEVVLLPLKVVPGASRSRLVGLHGDAVKLQVAAPPADGAANEAVLQLLAQQLGLARRLLTLRSGSQNPRKVVAITGLGAAELRQRLRDCCQTA